MKSRSPSAITHIPLVYLQKAIKRIKATVRKHPQLSLYFLFFGIHIALSIDNNIMLISDEGGYLSNARELVLGYNFSSLSFTFPGYSFVISPIFLLTQDLSIAFPLIHIVNTILMSFIPIIVFRLIRVLDQNISFKKALLATIALSLYPSFLVFSNLAMSEALFITLFALLSLLVYLSFRRGNSAPLYILTFVIAVLLFLTHPRGAAALIALACTSILLFFHNRKKPARKKDSFIIPGLLTIGGLLVFAVYTVLVDKSAEGYFSSIYNQLQTYSDIGALINQSIAIIGSLVYTILSTFGLVLIGLYFAVKEILKLSKDMLRSELSGAYALLLFSLITFVATLIIGTIGNRGDLLLRGDYVLYGRYIEAIFLPIFTLGLVRYLGKKIDRNTTFVLILCAVLLIGILFITRKEILDTLPVNAMNIFGLYFYKLFTFNWYFNIYTGIGIYAILAFIIYTLGSIKKENALKALIFTYILLTLFIWLDYFYRGTQWRSQQMNLVRPLERYLELEDDTPGTPIDYRDGSISLWHKIAYETYVPKINFNPTAEEITASEIIISHRIDLYRKYPGVRLVGIENYADQYMWILPGENQDFFIQEGYVLPADFPSNLPEEARMVEIITSLSQDSRRICLRNVNLPITLTHKGSHSLWPNTIGLGDDKYAVRIYSDVKDENYKIDRNLHELPFPLYPGDTVERKISLNCQSIPDGIYELTIGLTQANLDFTQENRDNTLKLTIHKDGNFITLSR